MAGEGEGLTLKASGEKRAWGLHLFAIGVFFAAFPVVLLFLLSRTLSNGVLGIVVAVILIVGLLLGSVLVDSTRALLAGHLSLNISHEGITYVRGVGDYIRHQSSYRRMSDVSDVLITRDSLGAVIAIWLDLGSHDSIVVAWRPENELAGFARVLESTCPAKCRYEPPG